MALPNVTKLCGIATDDGELNKFFAKLAFEEDEEKWPPQAHSSDEESVDSEGFIQVAGDGACPGGQSDHRLRRAGCGLSYGKKHSHNSSWKLHGKVQNAQRAEVRTTLRWAAWSWAKQVYITDSDYVFKGVQKVLSGVNFKPKAHRDLWRRIIRSLKAKGIGNHKIKKVAAHQTKKILVNETAKDKKKRILNEQADKLAVSGAKEHPASEKLA